MSEPDTREGLIEYWEEFWLQCVPHGISPVTSYKFWRLVAQTFIFLLKERA